MDPLSKFGPLQGLIKFWNTLSITQRFVTVVFGVTSTVLLIVVSMVATRPHMVVLFSGVKPEDAGAIVAKLQETKVPYEVDGTTIKVPEKSVYETRIQLASAGLPQSGTVGFEIFDKTSLMGMTEFSQRVSYQRAIQGELTRTINQIENIVDSKVIIAIPEESVYSQNDKKPTASVTVKLKPGNTLDSDKVAGIVHLVSSAVEGLEASRVTVVDMNGNMLSEATDDPTGIDPRMSSTQLKLKREYERVVEQDIQSMLERVLGPSKAIVRANAKINFDRKEENREIYEPATSNTGVLASQDRMDESYGSNSGKVGGAAGVPGTIRPGTATVTSTGDKGGYSRTQTTARYQVSKTITHKITAPGQVENMSVAVMVDDTVTESKNAAIQRAVATAAGIDEARGDKITVERIAFDNSTFKKEEKEMQAMAKQSSLVSYGKMIGGVLLLVGFLFFLKGLLKQVNISVPESVRVQEVPISEVAALQGYDSPQTARVGAEPQIVTEQKPVSTLPNMAQSQPEDIAQVLRKWMADS